jgi:cell division protein FtsN
MDSILYIIISVLAFVIGFLMSKTLEQKTKIKKLKNEQETRKLFLNKVFSLIELNESVNVKTYFDQAFEELKIENDNYKI